MRRPGTAPTLTAVTLITAMAAGLTGCANPEFTYVRHDSGQTYFKVPAAWRPVDQQALDRYFERDPESATAQVRKKLVWSVGYDAHAEPSVSHLYGIGTADEPFVFVRVITLMPEQRDMISLNVMRDAILPVTQASRQQVEQVPGYPLTGFELLTDEVFHPGDGVRGVRVRFNYAVEGAGTQTFDLTSYLDADGERLSMMLIRCSAACYRKRVQEFDTIAQSLKVKRPIG
ncbi:hypothetical protein HS041_24830 [Planomonospora sp. ID67723]|uniref:hypothetical protein n=1 Tax=Planomonospora sp. ID67723 TaxID=2738134 RepID=UPI0018C36A9E|nr:hypothetical protein [Planomonospora sp. ID67723]MBG0830988.1 hypothetical protein [Planomonospora sp. ID67723]